MYVHSAFTVPQFIECGLLLVLQQKKLIAYQNINQQYYENRTAMHIAVISNQIQIAKWLLQFQPDLSLKDSLQLTVSDWLKYKQNSTNFTFLLQKLPYQQFIQRNFINQNISILRASELSLQKVVQITKKQNPFIKDKQFKRTALHWASISGNLKVYQYLIQHKFDPLQEDIFGLNSIQYINSNPNNQIRNILNINHHEQNLFNYKENQIKQSNFCEVIIIGAGAAGIGAAVTLSRKGVPFIILEARQRYGGRILNHQISGIELDLGACWVHSYSKNNPIAKQVKKLNWKPKKSENRYSSQMMSQKGGCISQQVQDECRYFYQQFYRVVEKNTRESQKDLSIWDAGHQFYQSKIQKLHQIQKSFVDMLINMTQHYESASITQLSAKHYEDKDDQGGDFTPQRSYFSLLEAIIKSQKIQNNIKYKSVVKGINYQNKNVEVLCQNGQLYKCKQLIVSVPLGLLKKNLIKFTPKIPQIHQKIIQKLGFGVMNKIILSFKEPFWKGNPYWIRIACKQRGKFPAFYNFSTANKYVLCCFVTDNFAKKISQLTDQQIINDLMQLLCKTYQLKELKPIDYIITRWDQQPYSLGSYTHFDVNSCGEQSKELRKNIDQKIWLVGQHCYGQHIGTAHGAFQTGIWAAQQILQKFKPRIQKKQQK